MNYEAESINLAINIVGDTNIAADITAEKPMAIAIGNVAEIDIGQAITYIKSGQAEIETAVNVGIADFNDNSVVKTAAFNDNAANKISDFNDYAVVQKTLIDTSMALAKDWANKTSGTVDEGEYSAKYYAIQAATTMAAAADKDLSNLSTTGEAKFAAKQDVISDLSTIRSGASAGATAIQSSDLAMVATTGAYSDLSGTPNLSEYVTLGTTQIIDGNKTFSSDQSFNSKININNPINIAVNSAQAGNQLQFNDTNNIRLALIRANIDSLTQHNLQISAIRAVNGSSVFSSLSLCVDSSGNTYVTCPNSDIQKSIVTTVNKSKAQNGYFQLGNGLIINWGYTSSVSGNTTISLSKAFSSTNYAVAFGLNDSVDSYTPCVVSKTSTAFVYRCNSNRKSYWIAIGY